MYAPTANGTTPGRRRAHPQITASKPNVATSSLTSCATPDRSCREAREGACELRDDVPGDLAPREPALTRVGERDDGVEVRTGDRAEGEDQRDEPRACR